MSVARSARCLTGLTVRLRPVTCEDAAYVVSLRSGGHARQRYINPIDPSIEAQASWIEAQRRKDGDYYFVIEDLFDRVPLGLIGVYNIKNGHGEWGRWVVDGASSVAVESVHILMRFSFEVLCLNCLYCRTVEENEAVVRFHDGYSTRFEGDEILEAELRGSTYRLIEHRLTREEFETTTSPKWMKTMSKIFGRRLEAKLGRFEFHHVGIATRSILDAAQGFRFLGYKDEADFVDHEQGVRGLFMTARNQPRIELLENLDGSTTLSSWSKGSVAPYHFAYIVDSLSDALSVFASLNARAITSIKLSAFFGTSIVFLVLPNRFIVELIEAGEDRRNFRL